MKYIVTIEDDTWEIEVMRTSEGAFKVVMDGEEREADLVEYENKYSLLLEGKSHLFSLIPGKGKREQYLELRGRRYPVKIIDESMPEEEVAAVVDGRYREVSPMPGMVKEVHFESGQEVEEGATVMILEAMKMEIEIKAQYSGKMSEVSAGKGTSVQEGDTLFVVEVDE